MPTATAWWTPYLPFLSILLGALLAYYFTRLGKSQDKSAEWRETLWQKMTALEGRIQAIEHKQQWQSDPEMARLQRNCADLETRTERRLEKIEEWRASWNTLVEREMGEVLKPSARRQRTP